MNFYHLEFLSPKTLRSLKDRFSYQIYNLISFKKIRKKKRLSRLNRIGLKRLRPNPNRPRLEPAYHKSASARTAPTQIGPPKTARFGRIGPGGPINNTNLPTGRFLSQVQFGRSR